MIEVAAQGYRQQAQPQSLVILSLRLVDAFSKPHASKTQIMAHVWMRALYWSSLTKCCASFDQCHSSLKSETHIRAREVRHPWWLSSQAGIFNHSIKLIHLSLNDLNESLAERDAVKASIRLHVEPARPHVKPKELEKLAFGGYGEPKYCIH